MLVLSPLGAPLVGILLGVCPVDMTVTPQGPFAVAFSYCGIDRPVEHLYQQSVFATLLPMLLAGPLGGLVTAAWWLLGTAAAARCAWHLWRAFSRVTIERL